MDDATLNQQIQQLCNQRLPEAPASIEANVRRSIRQSSTASPDSFLPNLNLSLLQSSLALATLAVVTGISAALSISSIQTRQIDRQRQAREALNFDSFTAVTTVQLEKH